MLGKVHERASLRNQLGPHEFPDHVGQVWRNGLHSKLQVLCQRSSVLSELYDPVAKQQDVAQVFLGDLGTHGRLRSLLHLGSDIIGDAKGGKISALGLGLQTHILHDLRICEILCDDLAHLREVPPVPLPQPHREVVQLLVQIFEQPDSLDDHGVYLVWRELQLEAGERMGQSQRHAPHLVLSETLDERGEVHPDTTHDLLNAIAHH
mmetsp:Transcript_47695/g.103749  ORF Transcript_47695/g.103749 Transcript_47695/m.103749 type:complete len:207 (+) Transcript_47695:692-1312(+)